MELFPPLTKFYNSIADDARLGASHISLYMALLQQWNLSGGTNPIKVSRNQIMKAAKIQSRDTFNRHINALCEYGYISYQPAVNAYVQSKIIINHLRSDSS